MDIMDPTIGSLGKFSESSCKKSSYQNRLIPTSLRVMYEQHPISCDCKKNIENIYLIIPAKNYIKRCKLTMTSTH